MNKHASKASLFLIELIIAIFFFSLTSAICIQLFAGAYSLKEKTNDLNYAVMRAENAAEAFRACGGSLEDIAALSPEHTSELIGNTLSLYYDKSWQPSSRDAGVYKLLLTTIAENGVADGYIVVRRTAQDSPCIYELEVKHYLGASAERSSHE